jgi:hypothetical protein
MKKQTTVEWFFSELERMQYFIGNDLLQAVEQAKEMEKEQIIDAYFAGYNYEGGRTKEKAEQYYNETFKTE